METSSIQELAKRFNVSERTILRQIQTFLDKFKNLYSKGFEIPENVVNLIFSDKIQTNSDKVQTSLDNDENEEFPFVEYFTADEYEEFKQRITEYPFLKEQIENSKEYLNAMEGQMEYFRNAYNKQLEMHETLIQSVKNFSDNLVQRNFIEAKDKGLDTDSKK